MQAKFTITDIIYLILVLIGHILCEYDYVSVCAYVCVCVIVIELCIGVVQFPHNLFL